MRMRRITFLSALVAVGALLLLPACSDRGPHSLSDTSYWRVKFSNGQGIKTVVEQGAAAVPLLNTLLADANENVVQYAAMAAQQIGAQASGTVPAMVNALVRFPDQAYVTQALRDMGGASVDHLVPLLSDSDVEVKKQAIQTLNGIGAPAAPALEPLLLIAEDQSVPTETRQMALVAIGSIGEKAVSAMARINEIALKEDVMRKHAAMTNKRLKYAKRVREKGGDR